MKRFYTGAVYVVLVFMLLLSFPASASRKIRIAVGDTDTAMAKKIIRYMKKCGMTGVQVKSASADPYGYDGLIIPGGKDITPALYGEKKGKKTAGCDVSKDIMQIELVKKFAGAGKPVLGICRGCQIVNVAYGGTLKQHVGYRRGMKTVRISKKSVFYGTLGKSRAMYHYHHQCAEKKGKDIVYTMYSRDGKVVEGLRHARLPVYGIQFHPENSGKAGVKLGKKFAKICGKYRK